MPRYSALADRPDRGGSRAGAGLGAAGQGAAGAGVPAGGDRAVVRAADFGEPLARAALASWAGGWRSWRGWGRGWWPVCSAGADHFGGGDGFAVAAGAIHGVGADRLAVSLAAGRAVQPGHRRANAGSAAVRQRPRRADAGPAAGPGRPPAGVIPW